MQKPTLLILAAGMGSRFGGLKQIEPIGPSGETLLDYSVYDALRAGFGKLVFVIQREFEGLFRERIGKRFESRCEVEYAFQQVDTLPDGCGDSVMAHRKKPWGTGHAVWCAREFIKGPFAVINADDFYGRDSFVKLAGFLSQLGRRTEKALGGCMVGFQLSRTLSEYGSVSRGVCTIDKEGRLLSVEERTDIEKQGASGMGAVQKSGKHVIRVLGGNEIVSMNCWGMDHKIFPFLEAELCSFLRMHGREERTEFYLPFFVNEMISQDKMEVQVLPTDGEWFGVTYREDHPRVVTAMESLIKSGEYPACLWERELAGI